MQLLVYKYTIELVILSSIALEVYTFHPLKSLSTYVKTHYKTCSNCLCYKSPLSTISVNPLYIPTDPV
jgi:hypothetical protein